MAGAAGRVATTPETVRGVSSGRNGRAGVRIVGSPVVSAVNALILAPLLRCRLEPVVLEHCLTLFAQEEGDEC
jgi:hypothetical protein